MSTATRELVRAWLREEASHLRTPLGLRESVAAIPRPAAGVLTVAPPMRRIAVIVFASALLLGLLGSAAYVGGHPGPRLPGVSILAYIDSGTLYFVDSDGTDARWIQSGIQSNTNPRQLAWSSSGAYLVVTRDHGTDNALVVVDSEGMSIGTIVVRHWPQYSWSTVGDEIAVVEQGSVLEGTSAQVRVYTPEGTLVRRLRVPQEVVVITALDWSPDGRQIVIAGCIACDDTLDSERALTRNLWLLDAYGGRPVVLADLAAAYPLWPVAYVPSGDTITVGTLSPCALLESEGGCSDVWSVPINGGEPQLVLGNVVGARWSPQGSDVLITRVVDGSLVLFVAPSDHLDLMHRLADNLSPVFELPGWSPDGSRILYSEDDANSPSMWSIKPDGSDKVRLAENAAAAAWQPVPR
jgi:Tol biopolymer transport system component